MIPKWECGTAFPPKRARDYEFDGVGRFLEALVASAFGLRAEALRLESRGPAPVAFARQVAIYLAHTRLGLSYTKAGAFFGRDRTTAAHACRTVEDRREDPRTDAMLAYLEGTIDLRPNFAGRARP